MGICTTFVAKETQFSECEVGSTSKQQNNFL